jgi:hypothetical protein
MSPPAQPSLDLDQAAGLFSERQIARPLIVAVLITLALYPTLMHFLEPAALPDWIGRYLGNGYCRFMLALFVASALYAVLQYLGLQSERRALIGRDTPDQDGRQSVRSRLQDWIDFSPDASTPTPSGFQPRCDAGTAGPTRVRTRSI